MKTHYGVWVRQMHSAVLLAMLTILSGCRTQVIETAIAQPTSWPASAQAATSTVATRTLPAETPSPAATLEKEPTHSIEKLAFSSFVEDAASLYVVSADGTDLRQIADTVAWRGTPSYQWSPDGQGLAWVAPYQEWSALYVIRELGAVPQRLTDNMDVRLFEWSPDGREIAFSAILGEDEDIYVVSLDTLALVNLTVGNNAIDWGPKWSHDGKRIAFLSSSEARNSRIPEGWLDGPNYAYHIYVMDRDGSNRWRITEDNSLIDDAREECGYSWSPDDRYLVFMHACSVAIGGPFNLYVCDLHTGQVSKLLADSVEDGMLGRSFWFSDDELLFEWGNELRIMERDGVNQRSFLPWSFWDISTLNWTADYRWFVWWTSPSEILIGDRITGQVERTGISGYVPVWSPSGEWIAFTTVNPGVGNSEIWVMNREGQELHKVSGDVVGKNYHIMWAP